MTVIGGPVGVGAAELDSLDELVLVEEVESWAEAVEVEVDETSEDVLELVDELLDEVELDELEVDVGVRTKFDVTGAKAEERVRDVVDEETELRIVVTEDTTDETTGAT